MSRAVVSPVEYRQRKFRNYSETVTRVLLPASCYTITLVAALAEHLSNITYFKHFADLLVKQNFQQKNLWFGIKEVGIKHLHLSRKANCPKSLCQE